MLLYNQLTKPPLFPVFSNVFTILTCILQAKFLKIKLLLAVKDYSGAIADTGYMLKEDENNLDALLLRGRGYYYLADHDVALRYT